MLRIIPQQNALNYGIPSLQICCNCGGAHNHQLLWLYIPGRLTKPQQLIFSTFATNHLAIKTPLLLSKSSKIATLPTPQVTAKTYVVATKCKPVNNVNILQVLQLITSLLTAMTTNQDSKLILKTTIRSFLTILSTSQNC